MKLDGLSQSSLFMGVPTIYKRLYESDRLNAENTKNTRLLISGSAPMSVDLLEKIYSKTGHKILEDMVCLSRNDYFKLH